MGTTPETAELKLAYVRLSDGTLYRIGGGGGGGGGATTLNDLTDVVVSSPTGEQVLSYSEGSDVWVGVPANGATASQGANPQYSWDGDAGTNWYNTTHGVAWNRADFGTAVTVDKCRLITSNAIANFILEWSDNDSTWTQVGTTIVVDSSVADDTTITFAAQTHRYWRIYSSSTSYVYLNITLSATVAGGWTNSTASGLDEAAADLRYLQLTGGTVSGLIAASTAPSTGDHLTNKTYVDAQVATAPTSLDDLTDVSTTGAVQGSGLGYAVGVAVWVGLPTTVTESGHEGGNWANYAWDNNSGTRWEAGSGTPWTVADFGTPVTVSRLTAASYNIPDTWMLEGSANGSTWTTVVTSIYANTGAGTTTNFTPVTYRYWRASMPTPYNFRNPTGFTLYNVVDSWVVAAAGVAKTGDVMSGRLDTAPSGTGSSGLRLPHGAAPTSPADGDVWTTSAGTYVRINGATVGPLSSGGTTILSGTTDPTAGTGTDGNYYVNSTAQKMFGPKAAVAYGANQSVGPFAVTQFTASIREYGMKITCAKAGQITHIRTYKTGGGNMNTAQSLRIWNVSDQTKLADFTADLNSGSGWVSIPLPTPIQVVAGQQIVAALGLFNATYAFQVQTSPFTPITSGDLSATACVYNSTFNSYPSTTDTSWAYALDIVYQPLLDTWPEVLQGPSTVVGGTKPTSPPVGTIYVPSGSTVQARSYAQNIASGTTVVVTHNLATTDVVVAVYKLSDGLEVDVPFARTSTNAITLNSAIDLAGHRVVVLAAGG